MVTEGSVTDIQGKQLIEELRLLRLAIAGDDVLKIRGLTHRIEDTEQKVAAIYSGIWWTVRFILPIAIGLVLAAAAIVWNHSQPTVVVPQAAIVQPAPAAK